MFEEIQKDALELFLAAGHTPELDGDGKPDPQAFDIDPNESTFMGHNGYRCTACHACICVFCIHAGYEMIEPCSPELE